jgi:hypothetical protein
MLGQRLERVVEYARYFPQRSAQAVHDRSVAQWRND